MARFYQKGYFLMGCGGLLACGSLRSVFFLKAGGYKITSDTLRLSKNMAVQTGSHHILKIHHFLFASLKATFPFADFFCGFSGFQAKPNQRKAKAKACRAAFGQMVC
jgi:hypothetical protein